MSKGIAKHEWVKWIEEVRNQIDELDIEIGWLEVAGTSPNKIRDLKLKRYSLERQVRYAIDMATLDTLA